MTSLLAASETNPAQAVLGLFFLALIVAAYWTPTIVVVLRKGNIASVAVINGLLGWTFIGWVVALAMAFNKPADVHVTIAPPQAPSL